MIRFMLRVLGLCVFAAGFVVSIIDGSRSIAGSAWLPTALATVVEAFIPDFQTGLRQTLQSIGAENAEGLVVWVLQCPASIILLLLGLLLLWVGRKRPPPLGFQRG